MLNTINDKCSDCGLLSYLEANEYSPEIENLEQAHYCIIGEDIQIGCQYFIPEKDIDPETRFMLLGHW